jgi:hypothetical protein
VGWIDPADGKKRLFEEALAEAESYGSWGGYPFEVLQGIYKQNLGEDRPDGISVTQLLGCARKVHLEKLHEFYGTVESNYAAFRGVIAHSMLEKFKVEHTVVERRFWRTYRGIPLSGQLDYVGLTVEGISDNSGFLQEWLDWCDRMAELELSLIDEVPVGCDDRRYFAEDRRLDTTECSKHRQPEIPKGAKFLIRDWKSKDELPTYQYVAQQYQKQGNLYRWLLRIPAKKADIEFVFVSMKGVRVMKMFDGGVFSNGRAKPKQIWTDSEVEAFLDDRLVLLAISKKLDKPLPYAKVPDEDLWACERFCPAKDLCYRLAGKEALAEFKKGEAPDRITPRQPEKKKRGSK